MKKHILSKKCWCKPEVISFRKGTWADRFKRTKFAKGGGLSFECSDYEGMYDDLLAFISKELELARRGGAREVIDRIEFEIGNYENIPEWKEVKRMFVGDKQEEVIRFLEWYNKKQLDLLATLRDEKEGV